MKRENNRGGVLFDVAGNIHAVPWHKGDGLKNLYHLIGCNWVEAVRLSGPLAGLSMWCDEEGKLKKHTANIPASLLYRCLCGGDYMAGRVLILADGPEGDSLPLSELQRGAVAAITRILMRSFAGERIEATGPRMEFVEA